jgi:hypothetical protein
MFERMRKYPRTHHIEGSRRQVGDEDLDSVPFGALAGQQLVVEEKVDGANAGISFDGAGNLRLQSRGHFLTGGPRERHFALFKSWAARHQGRLYTALGERFILYGEWVYAKHTVFYDTLPHYFLEFDVLDTATNRFLGTPERRALLAGVPVASVPVLHEGRVGSLKALRGMIGRSTYKSEGWQESLAARCIELGIDPALVRAETDPSDLMEGLYVKVEEDGAVVGRYKYIRADFLATVLQSGSHWLDRPIVPNGLGAGVDIFSDE